MYHPDRHEPLDAPGWTEARAISAIEELMTGLAAAPCIETGWTTHPSDAAYGAAAGNATVYMGSMGVYWAMHHLRDLVAPPPDLAERVRAVTAVWPRGDSDTDVPSGFLGQSGVWGVAHRVADMPLLAQIEAVVDANAENPTWEVLWGSPGTMEIAWHLDLHAAWARSAQPLIDQLTDVDGLTMWVQDLYRSVRPIVGAGHGLAGNVHALLRPDGLALPLDRLAETIEMLAIREDGLANWPASPGFTEKLLLQWCHGAPGIVTSLRSWPDDRLDGLLAEGGELVWHAGPLAKGASLCHGTAGNGYAFLVLHRRTGEARWLERARAFAMHAVEQVRRERANHGMPRASLFTGDAGVACFVASCLRDDDRMPVLDVF